MLKRILREIQKQEKEKESKMLAKKNWIMKSTNILINSNNFIL